MSRPRSPCWPRADRAPCGGHSSRREPCSPWSHRLDQDRTAKTAADALGGDAAFLAEPLQRVDEMQRDAVAAGADGMAERNRAAIDVEFSAVKRAGCARQAENIAAEFLVLPGSKAAEHLRCERLVEFEQLDVIEAHAVALHQFGDR